MSTDFLSSLKNFFDSKGISQAQIAQELGVTKAYVNALFAGRSRFGKKQAEKWSNHFGLSKSWLLTGEGEMLAENENLPHPPAAPAPADSSQQLIDKLLAIIAEKDSLIQQQAAEIGALRAHLPDLPTA